jgi:hypothetical protein
MYLSWEQWLEPVILATQEVEIGRIMVRDQSKQRVWEVLSQLMAGCGDAHYPSYTRKHNRIVIQADSGIKQNSISEIVNAKRAAGGLGASDSSL